MKDFKYSELRLITSNEIKVIQAAAKKGDGIAQWKMALCTLYGQCGFNDLNMCYEYLLKLAEDENPQALMLLGYMHEHALGCEKDYTLAISFYIRAYDAMHEKPSTKVSTKKDIVDGLEAGYHNITKQIATIVTTKGMCVFKDGKFFFPWTADTRKKIETLLPKFCKDVEQFSALYSKATTGLSSNQQGEWEFNYQDKILMPVEVMKTVAARDSLDQMFKKNGYECLPHDNYFDEAIGRCLIDDDDSKDNDYIIGGLLQMAGHDSNPLWQYRVGLWYEYSSDNLEPQTAAFWYSKASKFLDKAAVGLERVKSKPEYKLLNNIKEGTVEDCARMYLKSAKNPEANLTWIIEGALRGNVEDIRNLQTPIDEKSFNREKNDAQKFVPYYKRIEEEQATDKKILSQWQEAVDKDWRTCARNQVIYNLYITKVEDLMRAIITTRFSLGWLAEETKTNLKKMPYFAKETHDIDEAINLSDDLNKGGLQSSIKAVNGLGESIRYNVYTYSESLLSLAKDGNPIAQYNLGMCYYNGDGTKENEKEAIKWLHKAAEQDVPEAMFQLGYILIDNYEFAEGIEWLTKAADQEDADAQYHLGMCYYMGVKGLKSSKVKSVKLFTQAAKQGQVDAQLMLGNYYYQEKEDYDEAVKWYRMAAEQGNAEAQYAMGECWFNGKGLKKDKHEAYRWYLKAAEQGNADAKQILSEYYRNIYGVKNNSTKADKRRHK